MRPESSNMMSVVPRVRLRARLKASGGVRVEPNLAQLSALWRLYCQRKGEFVPFCRWRRLHDGN